jgi:hypothetical protein
MGVRKKQIYHHQTNTLRVLAKATPMTEMEFTLFSKVSFQVHDPVTLIECYCFQGDFYLHYDLISNRKLEDVGKIGARIDKAALKRCRSIVNRIGDLGIFRYKNSLDEFLQLDDRTIGDHVQELHKTVIKRLLDIPGIGLSRATKLLHTVYPEIMPIIDNMYQRGYCRVNERSLTENQSIEILLDYYKNLKIGDNLRNLSMLHKQVQSSHLLGLTKVRIFDILWWSYLKSENVADELRAKNPGFRWSVVAQLSG